MTIILSPSSSSSWPSLCCSLILLSFSSFLSFYITNDLNIYWANYLPTWPQVSKPDLLNTFLITYPHAWPYLRSFLPIDLLYAYTKQIIAVIICKIVIIIFKINDDDYPPTYWIIWLLSNYRNHKWFQNWIQACLKIIFILVCLFQLLFFFHTN